MSITVNDFGWIETEKSRGRHEARRLSNDVDEVYDPIVSLPGPRGEPHPTPNLRTRSIGANLKTNMGNEPLEIPPSCRLSNDNAVDVRDAVKACTAEPSEDIRFAPAMGGRDNKPQSTRTEYFPPRNPPFGWGVLECPCLINSCITKRLGELPDVGKANTRCQGGSATIRTARIRGHGYSGREACTPDLSSQVCTTNEFNVSVLMTSARLVGVVIPCDRVDDHLEIYICLNAGKPYIALPIPESMSV